MHLIIEIQWEWWGCNSDGNKVDVVLCIQVVVQSQLVVESGVILHILQNYHHYHHLMKCWTNSALHGNPTVAEVTMYSR
jgi:hypothetical protein